MPRDLEAGMPRDLEADRGSGSSRLHPVAAALQSAKARTFVGPWTGWVFKTGHRGVGYYRDTPAACADIVEAVDAALAYLEPFPALPNVAYSAAPNTLCRAPRLDRITIWRKKSNHSLFGAPFAEYAVAYSASKSLIRPLATPIRQLSSLIRRPFVAYSAAK